MARADGARDVVEPVSKLMLIVQGLRAICSCGGFLQLRVVLVGRFLHRDRKQKLNWNAFEASCTTVLQLLGC